MWGINIFHCMQRKLPDGTIGVTFIDNTEII
jgi:hypothetical protein